MDFIAKVKALLASLTESAKAGQILVSTLGVLAIGGAGVGGFAMYEAHYGPEAIVSAEVNSEFVDTQTESVFPEETEETELLAVTEETETETETEIEVEPVLVKLVGSSIERDLKIKIQDENKKNVKGVEFYITVTPDKKNASDSVYKDHDKDGIIYIVDYAGGDYVVSLQEIEGYYTEEESIKVTVKEEIVYEKVEVQDEIKTEAEVSPSEDAETKEDIKVEAEITDTVPLLESKVVSTPVDASTIDKTPYMSAVASVGANGTPVMVPLAVKTSAASFSYKNLFLVGTGSTEQILPLTESSSELSSETTSQTISEVSSEVPSETPSEVPSETISEIPSEVPSETASEVPSEVPSETPSEVPSETPSETPSIVPATLVMPGSAKLFISGRTAANEVSFSVTIDDQNTTKIVDEANIKWSVKNDTTGGLAVSGTGKTVKVSAANASKAGTAVVVAQVPYTASGSAQTAVLECAVTVEQDTYDATIVLEDSAGDVLYTDSNCTKTATVADLMEKNVTTFYKNPKYQGWQAINGKLYYFNEQYQPVTGEQTINGIMYNFGADGSISQSTTSTGIDVSKWQGTIDWKAVKDAGIEFAIIRVGYRGSETGVLVEDPTFKRNIKGATEAGLKVGVYFFTQAITKAEAVEEASMALSLTSGYNLAYPIFIDTESGSGNARANGLDKATRTEIIDAFCKTVQNGGRKAGVYASKSWYNDKLNVSKLNNYYIWVAQYNTECTYTGRYDMWQYTETGNVSGIKGNVDLNISYMN